MLRGLKEVSRNSTGIYSIPGMIGMLQYGKKAPTKTVHGFKPCFHSAEILPIFLGETSFRNTVLRNTFFFSPLQLMFSLRKLLLQYILILKKERAATISYFFRKVSDLYFRGCATVIAWMSQK